MYITCQECDTIFRLDERLLKPTGSKVRCSQCGNIFFAVPPALLTPEETPWTPLTVPPAEPEVDGAPSSPVAEADGDQGLEGIDPAEIDSLMEQGRRSRVDFTPIDKQNLISGSGGEATAAEMDDEDLEIDFDAEFEFDAPDPTSIAADLPKDTKDELDLEMEFELDGSDLSHSVVDSAPGELGDEVFIEPALVDLSMEEEGLPYAQPVERTEAQESLAKDFELALDNLDLQSDVGATLFADISDSGLSGQAADELELDFDLEDMSGAKESLAQAPATVVDEIPELELDEDMDQELELDLDLEDVGFVKPDVGQLEPQTATDALHEPVPPVVPVVDDFNLSDFDAILDEARDEVAVAPQAEQELTLDFEGDVPRSANQTAAEEALEELAFELDAEYQDKPIAHADSIKADALSESEEDEIDLSDIEQMLEADTTATTALADSKKGREKWTPGQGQAGGRDLDDSEIDLSEIEAAIDAVDDRPEDETATMAEEDLELSLSAEDKPGDVLDFDLDFDLDLDSKSTAEKVEKLEIAQRAKVIEEDIELDLSDLGDLMVEDEKLVKSETLNTGDMELEFHVEEDAVIEASSARTHGEQTIAASSGFTFEDTIGGASPAREKFDNTSRAVRPKKKSSSALLVILILILLAAIGYGVYYAVVKLGVEIPYVSDYLTPKPVDTTGVLNLTTLEINSKFIENNQAGRLFVITGKVHNSYPTPRGAIRLQGKLFTKGKVLSKSEYAYAGIKIDDQELASGTLTEIKKRLDTVPQPQDAATKVLPNQNLDFIVVFSDLPAAEELDEFAVELAGSIQAQ